MTKPKQSPRSGSTDVIMHDPEIQKLTKLLQAGDRLRGRKREFAAIREGEDRMFRHLEYGCELARKEIVRAAADLFDEFGLGSLGAETRNNVGWFDEDEEDKDETPTS